MWLVLQRYNCNGDHNKNKAQSFGYQSWLRNPDSSILYCTCNITGYGRMHLEHNLITK